MTPSLKLNSYYNSKSCRPSCTQTLYNPQPSFAPFIEQEITPFLTEEWRRSTARDQRIANELIAKWLVAPPPTFNVKLELQIAQKSMWSYFVLELPSFLASHGYDLTMVQWPIQEFRHDILCDIGAIGLSSPYWLDPAVLLKLLEIKNTNVTDHKTSTINGVRQLIAQNTTCPHGNRTQCDLESTSKATLQQVNE